MKRSGHTRRTRHTSRRSGFSRAEVLGSLGAAGVLGALVIPASAQGSILDLVFGRGERTPTCQSNQKQIMLGVLQYQQDYDERSPLATSKGAEFGWANAIQPYIKSAAAFQCPAEKHVPVEPEPGADLSASIRQSIRKAGFTDYWLNSRASGKAMSDFALPAQSIATGDGDGGSPASNARYHIAGLPPGWVGTKGSPSRRHVRSGVEGANYAFLDGHVKWYTPDKISTAGPTAGGKPTFAIGAGGSGQPGF